MSKFITNLARASALDDASNAPLDTHGGRPTPSLLTKSLEDLSEVLERDVPPFKLSDLVRAGSEDDVASPLG